MVCDWKDELELLKEDEAMFMQELEDLEDEMSTYSSASEEHASLVQKYAKIHAELLYTQQRISYLEEKIADEDGGICRFCSGSGEGQYDGQVCWKCRGSGVECSYSREDDLPDPEFY